MATQFPYPYKTVSRRESYGDYAIGSRIDVAVDFELSDEAESEIYRLSEQLANVLYRAAQKADPKVLKGVEEQQQKLLGLFPEGCGHEEIPNEYSSSRIDPWYRVYTQKGPMIIGWRKRVIQIEWTRGKTAEELFPDEDTTKMGRTIHAWGYEKASEYVQKILAS